VRSEVEDLVTAGNEALKAGDWVAAKRAFSAAYSEFRRRSDPVGAANARWRFASTTALISATRPHQRAGWRAQRV
jgi:hypothetical protein